MAGRHDQPCSEQRRTDDVLLWILQQRIPGQAQKGWNRCDHPLPYPKCRGKMRVVAFIKDPDAVQNLPAGRQEYSSIWIYGISKGLQGPSRMLRRSSNPRHTCLCVARRQATTSLSLSPRTLSPTRSIPSRRTFKRHVAADPSSHSRIDRHYGLLQVNFRLTALTLLDNRKIT